MDKLMKKERKSILKKELKEYEAKIGTITAEEREELRNWVSGGNSPYDNPCLLYEECGHPMDFITAIRINEDMINNPSDYVYSTKNTAFEEDPLF